MSDDLCKYSAEFLQNALDIIDQEILLLDEQGLVHDMNKRVYESRGRKKQDMLHLTCKDIAGEDFCCEEQNGSCPFKKTRDELVKSEAIQTVVDGDGRMRYSRISTFPVLENGALKYIIQFRQDVTNTMNMELRLKQSEKLAAIGELSTYIAHEIRNPLFAIGGFANSLQRSASLSESDREKVSIILQESKRLDKILKSTINFARPTETEEGIHDLNVIVKETVKLLSIGCEERNIEVHEKYYEGLPMVRCDADLLKQCLVNIIRNALEAMPEGGMLNVVTDLNGEYVFVRVQDTGSGIPEELREKVFNPFFSTKDKGAGLGLPQTKKIIEDMGGMIDIRSKTGKGTTVILGLRPVLAVDEKEG